MALVYDSRTGTLTSDTSYSVDLTVGNITLNTANNIDFEDTGVNIGRWNASTFFTTTTSSTHYEPGLANSVAHNWSSGNYFTTFSGAPTWQINGTAGITISDPVTFHTADTTTTSINIPHGTAPSTPANGDIWTTTAGLFVRANGTTIGPLSDSTGTGDVTKVGTPVDNQVGVWTGDGTIEGDANFTWTGSALTLAGAGVQFLVPLDNDAATPSIAFGDGDSGFYESVDDEISVSTAGTRRWYFNGNTFQANSTNGPYLENSAAGATNPTLVPNKSDVNTGIGWAAADQLSLVAGGVESRRLTAATVQTTDATQTEIISVAVASGTTFGYRINIVGNESATGDTVFESIFGAIHNQGGTTAIVGSDIVDRTEDAGAAAWVVTVAADDTTDALTVDVTGEAAHTIDWKVSVEILDV